jgi:hypothetical protein
MSPTYFSFGCEVSADQVGEAAPGLVRDRRLHATAQPDPGQLMFTHHPRAPLVIDPLTGGNAVVELGGHPWGAVGAVPALGGVLPRAGPRSPSRGSRQPRVERRPRDLDDLTQPLHAVGVLVVLDELEAVHQFVSPAKYFAA